MNKLVNAISKSENKTFTANGDKAFKSSGDSVLDFFYFSGAARSVDEETIKAKFRAALTDNEDWAIRSLLYARDIREGLGERRLTRVILGMLASEYPKIAIKIMSKIVDMGRWDDLFSMIDGDASVRVAVFAAIEDGLESDNAGLVAKWMPRKGPIAARIRGVLGLNERDWRKLLVSKTNVVEQKMCAREWTDIDYSSVPSVASGRYAKAFGRHDAEGYGAYIQSVKTGAVNEKTGKVEKINTEALYPYNVYTMPRDTAQIAWDNLKDVVGDVSFMPIIDVSGSMTVPASGSLSCLQVAISLGVYLSERNKSDYKNLAITFSTNPAWIKINPSQHILDRFRHVENSNWQMSTDLDKAMNLILDTAVKNNVPQSDLPDFLLVLSDMQFNGGYDGGTAAKRTKEAFKAAGYKVPNIVWWNLNSSYGTTPVKADANGMVLASGFSPAIMKNILSGEVTPVNIMLSTLLNPRYDWN